MKKNLVRVLGLVILLHPLASCEPEDELNSFKISQTPVSIQKKSQSELEASDFDKNDIKALSCDRIETTTLYAENHREVGLMHVSNSDDHLFVTYDLNDMSWSLKEIHLYVGSEAEIPIDSNEPVIGQFPYRAENDKNSEKEYTFAIPREDLDTCLVIIAHAIVQRDNSNEPEEVAYGYGHQNSFSENDWGWYLDYCMKDCDDLHKEGDPTGDSLAEKSISDEDLPEDWKKDCLVSYAFNASEKGDSHCFLSSGFDQWGWTNQLFYNPQMNYASGYVKSFPLLASAYQCDIRNSLEVGYVTLTVRGTDGEFTAEVEVTVTDETYDLETFDLYVGTEKFPRDAASKPTMLPDHYTIREPAIGLKTFTLNELSWPVNANFIARGLLCPSN